MGNFLAFSDIQYGSGDVFKICDGVFEGITYPEYRFYEKSSFTQLDKSVFSNDMNPVDLENYGYFRIFDYGSLRFMFRSIDSGDGYGTALGGFVSS